MNYTFELNNARKDEHLVSGKTKATSPVVEIFSAMVDGKDLSRFGEKANQATKYIRSLGEKAAIGDVVAMAELNEIRKFAIQPRLLDEIKLLGVFGTYKPLAWGDTAYLEKIEYENVRAEKQAEGMDVSTPFVRKSKTPLAPITISGGHKVNYRELANGDMSTENELKNEVIKTMRNKATMYVIETVYKAIAQATGVKYFYENAGLAKTSVDDFLTKIRRYGKPTVHGDYALLAQFLPWIGYSGTVGGNDITGVSQKILDEISDTGLVGKYNGAVLNELPNGYDFNTIVTGADGQKNYGTLLPAGLAIVTPTAPSQGLSPVQTFSIGGLTTFSGNSVSDGTIMSRFDLSLACGVATTDGIGIIHDSSLDSLA